VKKDRKGFFFVVFTSHGDGINGRRKKSSHRKVTKNPFLELVRIHTQQVATIFFSLFAIVVFAVERRKNVSEKEK
jgi:hypothetical protein